MENAGATKLEPLETSTTIGRNATTTESHPLPAGPPCGAELDSPLRTMFGLLILWGSMILIFMAHHMSDNTIRLDAAGVTSEAQSRALAHSLGPRRVLMQPLDLNRHKVTTREALENVARIIDMDLKMGDLKKPLGKEIHSYEFKSLPVYKALHKVIGNPDVGYAIQGKTIRLFEQKLEEPGRRGPRNSVKWEATLDLSDEPLMVFPSGDTELWFSVQMIRDLTQTDNPWRTMQVELWRGAESQNTSKQTLDDNGKGIISMSTKDNIVFQIERKAQPQGNRTPGRYQIGFYFQSFE